MSRKNSEKLIDGPFFCYTLKRSWKDVLMHPRAWVNGQDMTVTLAGAEVRLPPEWVLKALGEAAIGSLLERMQI